jgi:hypothetical protein
LRVSYRNASAVPLPSGSSAQAALGIRAHFFQVELLATTVLVIAAATTVIVPMLVLGAVSGRDFPFHLASWMDVARQWHHGTIYPQWAELANWGFGEPRFVFYPPVSWMIGATLGSLLPWTIVPTVFNWLALIAAGMSMYLLARECLPHRQAALAAMLFAANPYHLLLVYYRSDFAELLASVFFPLLPWGVMRIARDGWRGVPILALVLSLIWLCNAPEAVIAVYSVVFLFFIAYVLKRDLRLLLYGSAATAAGFGLSAFYILPAARERAWVQINQVLSDGLRPEQNFLFSPATSTAVNSDFNTKISCIVLLMGMLMAAAAIYIGKKLEMPRLPYWLVVALGAMSLFMMFRVSRPLWVLAPELHFVQFPWRYALPLGVAFSFFLGASAGKFRRLEIFAIAIFVFAGPMAKIWLAVEKPSSWNKADITQFQRNFDSGIGYRGTPEYLPNGANGKVHPEKWGNSETGETPPGTAGRDDGDTVCTRSAGLQQITLNVFDYPAWQVDVDGLRVSKLTDGDGRIAVAVPAGEHLVHIYMRRQWDEKLGIATSISTAFLLSSFLFIPWTKSKLASIQRSDLEPGPSRSTFWGSSTKVTMENREHGPNNLQTKAAPSA